MSKKTQRTLEQADAVFDKGGFAESIELLQVRPALELESFLPSAGFSIAILYFIIDIYFVAAFVKHTRIGQLPQIAIFCAILIAVSPLSSLC